MQRDRSVALAFGGLAAMATALGIGRFVYTPILPAMLGTLGWSKSDAGLVASANFLGYFIGALLAGRPFAVARPRRWLLAALAVSATSTAAMGLPSDILSFVCLRFIGGAASAFVIVCASTLVLERLSVSGRASLSAIHFAGVGFGIMISAIAVSAMLAWGASWRGLWIGSGSIAMLACDVRCAADPRGGQCRREAKARDAKRQTLRNGRDDRGLWAVRIRLCHHGDLPRHHCAADAGNTPARTLGLDAFRVGRDSLRDDLGLAGQADRDIERLCRSMRH